MKQIYLLSGLCLMIAAPALAQSETSTWYAGAGLGRMYERFQPDYKTLAGGDDQQFINDADGLQLDILAGWRQRLGNCFSLGYQGTFSVNRFAFGLSLPSEPATFRYSLPDTAIASLVPELRLGGVVSVFGEIGGGAGRMKQVKSASPYSVYDVDRWQHALAGGGGVRIRIGARADLFASYRQVHYARHEFDTFNAQGVHIEHVKEQPRARGFSIGITTNF